MWHAGIFRLVVYAVGQGLFQSLSYLPRAYYGNCGSFNMVFDCGTLEPYKKIYGTNAVENFVKYDMSRSLYLDLLIISHLHWDHVSLLPILLDRVNVRKVMLPYLTPCERLYELITEPNPNLEWYVMFIADPVSFLLGFGVEEVLLVGEGEGEARPPFPPGPPEESFPPDYVMGELMETRSRWATGILEEKEMVKHESIDPSHLSLSYKDSGEFRKYEDLLSKSLESDKLSHRIRPLITPSILISGCHHHTGRHLVLTWPYLRKIGLRKGESTYNFMRKIASSLRDCGIEDGGRLISEDGRCYLKSSDIVRLMRRPECIRKMRRVYSRHLKNLNEYSLTALVNAVFLQRNGGSTWITRGYSLKMRVRKLLYGFGASNLNVPLELGRGFLFMGDLSARDKRERSDIFSKLVSYYGEETIENLSYYQVPHHGSNNGWDGALSHLQTGLAAVSYGYNNLYGHPHDEHMKKIYRRSRHLIEVHEKSRYLISQWELV